MIVRVHHAIGDGLSLVAAFYRMFETASGAPAPPPQMLSAAPAAPAATATPASAASEKSGAEKSGVEKSGAAKQKSAAPAPASLGLVTRGASAAWRSACALIKVIALPVAAGDTRTCVTPAAAASKGAPSYVWTGERRVVALPPLPLERIKVPAFGGNLLSKSVDCVPIVYFIATAHILPSLISRVSIVYVFTNVDRILQNIRVRMSSQRIKNADACTINDVMVALIAGMWRRYLVHRRDPCVVGTAAAPKQLQIRALVPYSFPRSNAPADRDAMRNRWCFLSLSLPVEVAEDKPRTLQR